MALDRVSRRAKYQAAIQQAAAGTSLMPHTAFRSAAGSATTRTAAPIPAALPAASRASTKARRASIANDRGVTANAARGPRTVSVAAIK
jgi:hypothetical protein